MRIKIEKTGINGEGIGYWQQKPIFIDGTLPLEEVDVIQIEDQGSYALGKIKSVIKASQHRITPPCYDHAHCGGCTLMIADLDYQVVLKERNFKQALQKYGGNFDFRKLKPVIKNPVPLAYRNGCKIPVRIEEGKLVTGFYRPNSNLFEPIESCIVHDALLEKVKKAILVVLNEHAFTVFNPPETHGLRTLILRSLDHRVQATLVTGNITLEQSLIDALLEVPHLVSLYQSINTDRHAHDPMGKVITHLGGLEALPLTFANLQFELHPKAFFQLNRTQALAMFEQVVQLIKPKANVIDVYCGIGAMTLMISKKAASVIGIEEISDAIENAKRNAELNKIKNTEFICADASKQLKNYDLKDKVVVVDPPRSGLDNRVLDLLVSNPASQLIYISCNPSTLAKNLAVLQSVYTVQMIQPYDLFSQTPLLEAVVNLIPKV